MLALLLALLLLGVCFAQAESAESVYDVLTHLMNGRTFTLTVTAESEAEELANVIAQYGAVTCTLRQENDEILLTTACDGDAYLTAAATKEGVRFDTNLIENGTFSSNWAALVPVISQEADKFSVTMTGPDHELIRFTCKVSGTMPDDCQVEIDIGYITGPGNVHSLWDGITNAGSETIREFYFTFSEEESGLEGEGTTLTETAEDGSVTITREETCALTYQEDEAGEITFRSVLTIR
jgi:hypothetical protein